MFGDTDDMLLGERCTYSGAGPEPCRGGVVVRTARASQGSGLVYPGYGNLRVILRNVYMRLNSAKQCPNSAKYA